MVNPPHKLLKIQLHEYFLTTQGKDPIVIKTLLSRLKVEKRKVKESA